MTVKGLWIRFFKAELLAKKDSELMEMVAKDRDHDAFHLLFERHYESLYRYLFWLGGTESWAEEIVQESYFRVFERAEQYSGGSFRAWLFQIGRNLMIDLLRKKKEWAFQDEVDTDHFTEQDHLGIEAELLLKEEKDWLLESIKELPTAERDALTMWLSGDWNYEEMAQMMGLSSGNLKTQVYRAKKKLLIWAKERIENER